jgi:hypothetical protein
MKRQWNKVCVVASGPSLTQEDCNKLKDSGWKVIAVNNSWELVPWCDVVFACDTPWWNMHIDKVRAGTDAELWTSGKRARELHRINYVNCEDNPGLGVHGYVHKGGNSGYQAINLAYLWGAKQIFMLGFDCKPSNEGKAHWFGQHPTGLSQKQNFSKWREKFPALAKDLKKKNIEVYNLTRDTALTCFTQMSLEEALTKYGEESHEVPRY